MTGLFNKVQWGDGLTVTDEGNGVIRVDGSASVSGGGTIDWDDVGTGVGGAILTTKGDVFGYDTAAARIPIGTNGQVLTADSAQTLGLKWAAAPTGGSSSPLTTKGDVWGYSTADARLAVGSNGQVLTADSAQTLGVKWAPAAAPAAPAGSTALVYRYTVTGSDKASIDTGADTAQAGSNDWTNGDMLEVMIYGRTDEATTSPYVQLILNNDTSASYDRMLYDMTGVPGNTIAGSPAGVWVEPIAGASNAANYFGVVNLVIPNYASTVGYKTGTVGGGTMDTSAGNMNYRINLFGYRSTAAITRLKILPFTAGKNLKVGSQLLIYKRLAS